MLRALRAPDDPDDRGSMSVFVVSMCLAMIVLVGLVVDVSGQIRAKQHAADVAAQAARVGGQQLDAPMAIRGQGVDLDPAAAAAAARTYLAASDVTGTVSITGGTTVTVDTTDTYDTIFLSVIGINRLTVTGTASARTVRTLDGAER